MRSLYSTVLGSALSMLICAPLFANEFIDAEVASLKTNFSGGLTSVKSGVEKLEWSGITDEALFDQIAARLEANKTDVTSEGADLNAYLARALGVSGLTKYDEVLAQYEKNTEAAKLAKYAHSARVHLSQFVNYNAIISKDTESAPTAVAVERTRLMNMMRSNLPALVERSARQISEKYQQDAELLSAAHETLLATYKSATTSDAADAAAWVCKILGRSQNKAYTETLNTIANDKTVSSTVTKYAKKALVDLK